MFDPWLAIDPVFAEFGVPAVVQETIPRTITVLRKAPDDEIRLSGMGRNLNTRSVILEIRRLDMDGIGDGTRILVAGEMRAVKGDPLYRDDDRLVAFVNTAPV